MTEAEIRADEKRRIVAAVRAKTRECRALIHGAIIMRPSYAALLEPLGEMFDAMITAVERA
jgi:hypothetical protein